MQDVGPVQGTISTYLRLMISVATGSKYQHKYEEERLLKEALGLPVDEQKTSKGVQ